MRRDLIKEGADQLKYEIREIVAVARDFEAMGLNIIYENIGDPIEKGETVPEWIKEKISKLALMDSSYRYVDSAGDINTRKYLVNKINEREGAQITENDIIFFNGLGDAVSTLFSLLKREARVIGPSPAYSTLSSAEAAHSGYDHNTYKLDPENGWMPDLEDLEKRVKYNDSIAGILLINPDNPTGAVYPKEIYTKIVDIARKYSLFVICDETYAHIVYNGATSLHLSEVIEEVPGLALRSISKEFPWPGGRCGWVEVYNRDKDNNFSSFVDSLLNAKRLEVCSTSLPQLSIPDIYEDSRYIPHLKARNKMFEKRSIEAVEILSKVEGIKVILPKGAFYLTILFNDGVLNSNQKLVIDNNDVRTKVETLLDGLANDKRFVYYLLASTGICVVPLTGFCSNLEGFRMTLLESNDSRRISIINSVSSAIIQYLHS